MHWYITWRIWKKWRRRRRRSRVGEPKFPADGSSLALFSNGRASFAFHRAALPLLPRRAHERANTARRRFLSAPFDIFRSSLIFFRSSSWHVHYTLGIYYWAVIFFCLLDVERAPLITSASRLTGLIRTCNLLLNWFFKNLTSIHQPRSCDFPIIVPHASDLRSQ